MGTAGAGQTHRGYIHPGEPPLAQSLSPEGVECQAVDGGQRQLGGLPG